MDSTLRRHLLMNSSCRNGTSRSKVQQKNAEDWGRTRVGETQGGTGVRIRVGKKNFGNYMALLVSDWFQSEITRLRPPPAVSAHLSTISWGTIYVPSALGCITRLSLFISGLSPDALDGPRFINLSTYSSLNTHIVCTTSCYIGCLHVTRLSTYSICGKSLCNTYSVPLPIVLYIHLSMANLQYLFLLPLPFYTFLCLSISLFLHIFPFIHPSTYIFSICLYLGLDLPLSISISLYLSTFLSLYLSFYLYQSAYLKIYIYMFISIYLSTCLSIYLPIISIFFFL